MFVYEHFPNIAPAPNVFPEFLEDGFERDLSGEHIFNDLVRAYRSAKDNHGLLYEGTPGGLETLVW